MRKSTGVLFGMMLFFAGIICGFMFSPIKNGLNIGNNSGNNNGNLAEKKPEGKTKKPVNDAKDDETV